MHFGFWETEIRHHIMECSNYDARIRNYNAMTMALCGRHGGLLGMPTPQVAPLGAGGMGPSGPGGYGGMGPLGVMGYGGMGVKVQGGYAPLGYGAMAPGMGPGGFGSALAFAILTVGMTTSEDLVQRYELGLEVVKAW